MRKQTLKGLVFGAAAAAALLVSGCFTSEPTRSGSDTTLRIKMGVKDITSDRLAKGQEIKLSKLVVTLISSGAVVSDTLRDTLFANAGQIDSIATDSQSVNKSYNIKPLRNWTISVKTLDKKDSVIHQASQTINNVKIGSSNDVNLTLDSRFVMYVARFRLPDSLRAVGGGSQKLYINRLVMVVGNDTVRVDKTYFEAGLQHLVEFDYAPAGQNNKVGLYVFADSMGAWDPTKPVFGDTLTISPSTDSTGIPSLKWTGPGSKDDPNYDSTNPGGAIGNLQIVINKVKTTYIDAVPDSVLPFKRPAR